MVICLQAMIIHLPGTIPGKAGQQQIAIIEGDTHLSRWIAEKKRLDADVDGFIPRILDLILPGSVVIDAGASLGDHTAAYATKAARVHAFEPQPESFECLRQNCANLNVTMYNCGLSDHEGQMRIERRTNVGASPIASNGDTPISVRTLDSFGLAPALIKFDVEGHEIPALRGARNTIMRFRPVLVIEVNKWQLEPAGWSIRSLWAELRGLEYAHCTDIRTEQTFDPDDGRVEYDIVGMP